MKPHKPLRSLKSKALQLLAQREQSRIELRRKLTAHAHAEDAASTLSEATGAGGGDDSATRRAANGDRSARGPAVHAAARVDEVLAWLDTHHFQSDARFAESRIHARAGRYGDLRIRHELKQHGVALDADAARTLGNTESSRAWAIWERRFGTAPATSADASKQSRFLSSRGFSADAVRAVLRRARQCGEAGKAPFDDD